MTRPKLPRPYPLNIESVNECNTSTVGVGNSVIDNHTCDVCPPDKVRNADKGSDSPKACSVEMADNKEVLNSLQWEGSCEESSDMDPDLSRYWELEQEGPQVSDV